MDYEANDTKKLIVNTKTKVISSNSIGFISRKSQVQNLLEEYGIIRKILTKLSNWFIVCQIDLSFQEQLNR